MDNRKAPGEDGITADIYKSVYQILPKFTTAMYNDWLRGSISPNMEDGQDNTHN